MARTKKVAQFNKSDLTTGTVVEYANGKRRLVIRDFAGNGDVLFGCGDGERWTYLDNYNDDLTHKSKEALNIVKVYHHDMNSKSVGNLYADDNIVADLTVAPTASADTDFTIDDLCDTLQFTVKIVRG